MFFITIKCRFFFREGYGVVGRKFRSRKIIFFGILVIDIKGEVYVFLDDRDFIKYWFCS